MRSLQYKRVFFSSNFRLILANKLYHYTSTNAAAMEHHESQEIEASLLENLTGYGREKKFDTE